MATSAREPPSHQERARGDDTGAGEGGAAESKGSDAAASDTRTCTALIVHPHFANGFRSFLDDRYLRSRVISGIVGVPRSFVLSQQWNPSAKVLGAVVWGASIVLSQYLANELGAAALRGARVLELGCGAGALVGMAAASLGADVLSTDLEHVVALARPNVRANMLRVASVAAEPASTATRDRAAGAGTRPPARAAAVSAATESTPWPLVGTEFFVPPPVVSSTTVTDAPVTGAAGTALPGGRLQMAPFRWGPDLSTIAPACGGIKADFIVAADVIYEPSVHAALVNALQAASDERTTVVIGYRKRHQDFESRFLEVLLPAAGFVVQTFAAPLLRGLRGCPVDADDLHWQGIAVAKRKKMH